MATMIPNPFWRVVAPHGSVILNQNHRRMIPSEYETSPMEAKY
jgi:hypothetical protein